MYTKLEFQPFGIQGPFTVFNNMPLQSAILQKIFELKET